MDYEKIMEEATRLAMDHANNMYHDLDSKKWKIAFETEKHRQYYLMVTPPDFWRMTDKLVERYLYPNPSQTFDSLTEWLHEIRSTQPKQCPWDEEEFVLWMRNLWFSTWQDVSTYIERNRLKDKLFAWDIAKYWDENGNCTMAERIVNG